MVGRSYAEMQESIEEPGGYSNSSPIFHGKNTPVITSLIIIIEYYSST